MIDSDDELAIPNLPPGIVTVAERVVYQNDYVTVCDDDVQFLNGIPGRYLRIVEAQGRPGVACLATCDQKIGLVLVYRYPTSEWEWGIPRGFSASDDPRESMLQELCEELGSSPDSLTYLGTVTPNSGLLAGQVTIYHAVWSAPMAAPTDTAEVESIAWVASDDFQAAVRAGVIRDCITLSAIALAGAHGTLSPQT